MSLHEVLEQVQEWNHLFFFYEGGVGEALAILIAGYEHPDLVSEFGGETLHPVINDVDLYMTALDRCNASPRYGPDMMEMIHLALECIEQTITQYMSMVFGDCVFKVVDAIPISDRQDYAITIRVH